MKKIFLFLIFLFININSFSGSLIDFGITLPGGITYAGTTITVTITAYDYDTTGDGSNIKTDYNGYVTLTASIGDIKVIDTGSIITGNFINGQWTGDIVLYGANTPVTITCTDSSGATGIATKDILPGPYEKLLFLVEGMTFAPGTESGYTGQPVTLTTYMPFYLTVTACDAYYNKVTYSSAIARVYASVDYAITPTSKNLSDPDALGSYLFDMTIYPTNDISGYYNITAQDLNSPSISYTKSLYFISQNECFLWAEINNKVTETVEVIAGDYITVTVKASHSLYGIPISDFDDVVYIKAIRIPSGEDGETITPNQVSLVNGVGSTVIQYTKRDTIKIMPVYDKLYKNQYYVTKTPSNLVDVKANSPYSFIFYTDKTELAKDEQAKLEVEVKDKYNNLINDTEVYFYIKDGEGILSNKLVSTDYYGKAYTIYTAPNLNLENIVAACVTLEAGITEKTLTIISSKITVDKNKILNYPNPFIVGKENTEIDYYLEEDSDVKLRIYTPFGKLVWSKDIKKGDFGGRKGGNSIFWDGKSNADFIVGVGIYILKIVVENSQEKYTLTRKIAVKK